MWLVACMGGRTWCGSGPQLVLSASPLVAPQPVVCSEPRVQTSALVGRVPGNIDPCPRGDLHPTEGGLGLRALTPVPGVTCTLLRGGLGLRALTPVPGVTCTLPRPSWPCSTGDHTCTSSNTRSSLSACPTGGVTVECIVFVTAWAPLSSRHGSMVAITVFIIV